MTEFAPWASLVITVLIYFTAKWLHRRRRWWWCYPLLLTPVLVIAGLLLSGMSFETYMERAQWLLFLLGPATISFAVPVYECRAVLRNHAPVIGAAVFVSVLLTFGTSVLLAELIGLDDALARSVAPHSLTTPFAMAVSTDLGGKPDLAAVFAAVTGVSGIAVGHLILRWSPPRTRLAAGALLGAGASGAGVAKAHELGREEGAIASLVMILGGLCSILGVPLVAAIATRI